MAVKPNEFAELLREFIWALLAFRYPASASSYDLESRARELLDRAAELPVDVRTKTRTRTQLEELRRKLDCSQFLVEGFDPEGVKLLIGELVHLVRLNVVPKLHLLADELAVWLPDRPTESDGQSDNPVEPLAGVDETWGGQGRRTAKQLLAWARPDGQSLDVEPEVPCDPYELDEYVGNPQAETLAGVDEAGIVEKTPGKAGDASKQVEPSGGGRKAQPCQILAYYASRYAELKLERQLQAQEAYDYWEEYGFDPADKDTENAVDLAGYELPDSFPTFQSQLSHGRRAFDDSRYENRTGRKGRSIVSGDEIG